jgi:hypothetical protein
MVSDFLWRKCLPNKYFINLLLINLEYFHPLVSFISVLKFQYNVALVNLFGLFNLNNFLNKNLYFFSSFCPILLHQLHFFSTFFHHFLVCLSEDFHFLLIIYQSYLSNNFKKNDFFIFFKTINYLFTSICTFNYIILFLFFFNFFE